MRRIDLKLGGIFLLLTVGASFGIWGRSDAGTYRRIIGLRGVERLDLPATSRVLTRQVVTWPESAGDVEARADRLLTPERGWRKEGHFTKWGGGIAYVRTRPTSIIHRFPLTWIFQVPSASEAEDRVTLWAAYAMMKDHPRPGLYQTTPIATAWTTMAVSHEFLVGWGCGRMVPDWDLILVPAPR